MRCAWALGQPRSHHQASNLDNEAIAKQRYGIAKQPRRILLETFQRLVAFVWISNFARCRSHEPVVLVAPSSCIFTSARTTQYIGQMAPSFFTYRSRLSNLSSPNPLQYPNLCIITPPVTLLNLLSTFSFGRLASAAFYPYILFSSIRFDECRD